jgi:hypothetical protein
VMGNDYYITNEHKVFDQQGQFEPSGEIFGYYVITKQYFDRYRLPVMHTETNRKDADDAPRWLWKEWSNVVKLKQDGVPILGFTWYSLLDQVDWDTALRQDNHRINPLGLYDLKRRIRPVGKAYQRLIAQWRDQLPLQSMSRDLFLYRSEIENRQAGGGASSGTGSDRDTANGRRRSDAAPPRAPVKRRHKTTAHPGHRS